MTGADLRTLRKQLGLSQRELARLLHVPQPTIANWERGNFPIQHGRILELALKRLADGALSDLIARD